MTIKKIKGKIGHVRSSIHNPNVIVSTPPIKKHICRQYKLNLTYKFDKRLKSIETMFSQGKVTQINCSSFPTIEIPGVKIDDEMDSRNRQMLENNESSIKNLESPDDLPINSAEEPKVNIVAKALSTEENKPSVNWKLQKLEKKFLLKYLETSLQKYDKNIYMQAWIPSRNKSYFLNQVINFPSKRNYAGQTAKDYLTSWLKRRVTSSVQMCKSKNKCTQTSVCNNMPDSIKRFQKWVRNAYRVVEAMDCATKDNSVESLLNMDSRSKTLFQKVVRSLYNGANFFTVFEDDLWSDSIDLTASKADDISELQVIKVEEPKIPKPSVKKIPLKKLKKAKPKENKTVSSSSKVLPVPKIVKAKKSALPKSKMIKEKSDKIAYVPLVTKDIKNNEVIKMPNENLEDNEKLQFEEFHKIMQNILSEKNELIQDIFLNKIRLHSLLILVSEASQRLLYAVPFMDDIGLGLTRQLSSLQMDAKLAKRSMLDSTSDEILEESKNVCKYLSEATDQNDPISPLLDSLDQLLDETTAKFDPSVVTIAGNCAVLTEFVLLIKNMLDNYDHMLLNKYFNSLLEPNENEEDTGVDTFDHILKDMDLLAHALAVIHIWNERNEALFYNRKETNDNVSLPISYNAQDAGSNIEKAQHWIWEVTHWNHDGFNISNVYSEFLLVFNAEKLSKLEYYFSNEDLLNKLVSRIPVSPEMCQRANEIYNIYKTAISQNIVQVIKDDPLERIKQLLENPSLIAQFLSIVSYLADEEDIVNLKNLFVQINDDLLKHYLENGKSIILIKLYKLGSWLSQLDKHWIFSDVTQDIGIDDKVISMICNIVKNADLDKLVKDIYNDSELLTEAIGAVRCYISKQPSAPDEHEEALIRVASDKDVNEPSKTEPLNYFPEISQAKGKNQRYSQSEAENIDSITDLDPEIASLNVASIRNVKSLLDIADPLTSEPISATYENVDAYKDIVIQSVDDVHENVSTSITQPGVDDIPKLEVKGKSIELSKDINMDDTINIMPKDLTPSFQEKPKDTSEKVPSIDGTDVGLLKTDKTEKSKDSCPALEKIPSIDETEAVLLKTDNKTEKTKDSSLVLDKAKSIDETDVGLPNSDNKTEGLKNSPPTLDKVQSIDEIDVGMLKIDNEREDTKDLPHAPDKGQSIDEIDVGMLKIDNEREEAKDSPQALDKEKSIDEADVAMLNIENQTEETKDWPQTLENVQSMNEADFEMLKIDNKSEEPQDWPQTLENVQSMNEADFEMLKIDNETEEIKDSPIVLEKPESMDGTDFGMLQPDNGELDHIAADPNVVSVEDFQLDDLEKTDQMSVKVTVEFENEKIVVKESVLSDSLNAEKMSINSQINVLVMKLDDTLASIEIQCQTMNDMDLDIPKFTTHQFCETKIVYSMDYDGKLSSDGKSKAVKLDDRVISITPTNDVSLEADVDVSVASSPVSHANDDIIFTTEIKLNFEDETNDKSDEVEKFTDKELQSEETDKVNTMGMVEDVYKIPFSNQLVDSAYNFIGPIKHETNMLNYVSYDANNETLKPMDMIMLVDQSRPKISLHDQVEISDKRENDINEKLEEFASTKFDQSHSPIFEENEITPIEDTELSKPDHEVNSDKDNSSLLSDAKRSLTEHDNKHDLNLDAAESVKLSFHSQLNVLAEKLDENIEAIDTQYRLLTDMELFIPITVHSVNSDIKLTASENEIIQIRDLEYGPNVSINSQINHLEIKLDETINLVDQMYHEMSKDVDQEKDNDGDEDDRDENEVDREKNEEIDSSWECKKILLDPSSQDSGSENTVKDKKTIEKSYPLTYSDAGTKEVNTTTEDNGPNKVEKKNQASQSEIFDELDNAEPSRDTSNRDISSYQTVSTLGFMVYYLLTVLAGRESQR